VLHRALTSENNLAGFRATGIWPLNESAMDSKMGPSYAFVEVPGESQEPTEGALASSMTSISIREILEKPHEDAPSERNHYFVQGMDSDFDQGPGEGCKSNMQSSQSSQNLSQEPPVARRDSEGAGISRFLVLPSISIRRSRRAIG
jgi:hypothetical protein